MTGRSRRPHRAFLRLDPDSCDHCLAWGQLEGRTCSACRAFFESATEAFCDICRRKAPARDGVCRLCRKQASLNAGPNNKTTLDLSSPARTGHQLFLANLGAVPGSRPETPCTSASTRAAVRLVARRTWEPIALFDAHRRFIRTGRPLEPQDPELSIALLARAGHLAELHGWPPRTLRSVRRGLQMLCASHAPGERITASTAVELTYAAIPAVHVIDVLEHTEAFLDDRPDPVHAWCDRHLDFLPAQIRAEIDAWTEVLCGAPRHPARAQATILTRLRSLLPFLADHPRYGTLREVTRGDVLAWLDGRPHLAQDASALRSLFRTLKTRRLIFANPTRNIDGGKPRTTIPLPLAPPDLATIAQAAQNNPALHLVVALAGIHALPPRAIRALLTEQIDLPGYRLDPYGLDRPLDPFTADAVTAYLAERHRRWPASTNPYLLVSRNTATRTTPVSAFWLEKLFDGLPATASRLREDRILEQAAADGADPLHLAHVFALCAKASLRYTSARVSQAESTPTTCAISALPQ